MIVSVPGPGTPPSDGAHGGRPEPPVWVFPGWGESRRIQDLEPQPSVRPHHAKLGVWRATALCGNDITSSVLYVSALVIAQAGFLAPIALLVVGLVLYLFRAIYAEVVGALPLNGGTYTLLLNTTSKRIAAGAACLTLLSYIATAVISGSAAIQYGVHGLTSLQTTGWTVVLLASFAFLTIVGIGESATVALGIFLMHLASLAVLAIAGAVWIVQSPGQLHLNWAIPSHTSITHALVFGFGTAMLGISGFESSANFVEEQAPGVFPKTLRNMWGAVTVFNPLIAIIALGVLPMTELRLAPEDLLAQMADRSAGAWLSALVRVDAFLVLCGAVLTSFVGVTGLVRRMSLDRVLPQWLLHTNRWRGTNHWIVLGFFALCVSILLISRGRIELLAGVYALSFLCVMALFAIGNLLLKSERSALPREARASVPKVLVALFAVFVALGVNLAMDPETLPVFLAYTMASFAVVGLMFLRQQILAMTLRGLQQLTEQWISRSARAREWLASRLSDVSKGGVVYFTKGDSRAILNRAALYVLRNEQSNHLTVVHVHPEHTAVPGGLAEHLRMIDELYPELRVDFVSVQGTFGPDLIDALSARLGVPKNAMFIGTPSNRFPHRIEALGGVRVIL